MGNKRNRTRKNKKEFLKHLRIQAKRLQEFRLLRERTTKNLSFPTESEQSIPLPQNDKSNNSASRFHPKRLAVLCERVIKKYKLLSKTVDKPKLEPTSFTVVGGKPLRERKIKVNEDPIVKRPKAVRKPKVIKKGELLDKPPRGKITEKLYFRIPRKELTGTNNVSEHMITVDTEPGPARIKIEEELDLAVDTDPLGQDSAEDYTVVIKEEIFDSEVKEIEVEVPDNPHTPRGDMIMPILVPSLNPGQPSTSSAIATNVRTMTVICDEIQIFANNIAEQLRAMPVNRALLLQLDIQSMLDNERQLIMDES